MISIRITTTTSDGQTVGDISTDDNIRIGRIEFDSEAAAEFFTAFIARMGREAAR